VTCPHCGAIWFAAVVDITPNVRLRAPRRGDLGTCMDCGGALIHDGPGQVRALTAVERAALPIDVQQELDAAQREAQAGHN